MKKLFICTALSCALASSLMAEGKRDSKKEGKKQERPEKKRDWIKRIDTNNNMQIDANEIEAWAQKIAERYPKTLQRMNEKAKEQGNKNKPNKHLTMLKEVDADNNGAIEGAEISALASQLSQKAEKINANILKHFDKNKDGNISEDERKNGQEHISDKINQQKKKSKEQILQEFDKDGDGKLNKEERAAAKTKMKKRINDKKAKIMQQFDVDGDGKLNDAERQAVKEDLKKRRERKNKK